MSQVVTTTRRCAPQPCSGSLDGLGHHELATRARFGDFEGAAFDAAAARQLVVAEAVQGP